MDMARSVNPLSAAQVTRLAQLLDGPTGSELRRDLREARLPIGSESTKWRMLRESFELAQRRDSSANAVLRYVKLALDPARELAAAISATCVPTSTRSCCCRGSSSSPTGASCPQPWHGPQTTLAREPTA